VPVTDYLPAYVAKEKGFFDKHKVAVELQRIPLIANIPPALLSGSVQIGISTGPGFLQATEGGLDFVVVAAGARQGPVATVSLVARPDVGITKAADLKGKKVAMPGINSLFDVMFRKWLLMNNMRPSDVQIVEAAMPALGDLLRGKQVDAVCVLEPFRSRIIDAGVGVNVADFFNEVAKGPIMSFYMAERKWAVQNVEAVHAFRAALQDGIEFIRANEAEAREIEAKYLGLNAKVAPVYTGEITAADLKFYQDIGKELGLLQGKNETSDLLLK
jgi:NitT/TauT family transport system substrate-binding protein